MSVEEIEKDKEFLKELFESAEHRRLVIRYNALYALASGFSITEVSKIFCRDEDTIRAWVKKWIEQRSAIDKKRKGAPKKIGEKIENKIVQLVDENNPKKHGMNCSFWDCMELQKFFLLREIPLSRESIRAVLKKNGFRYVKAQYRYALADKAKQMQFLEDLPDFLRNRKKGSTVLFGDEMSSKLHPKNGYTWTRKERAIVKTFSSHKKTSVIGAVNPLTGAKEIMLSRKINTKAFVKFLARILKRFKGEINLFLDNFPTHKTKVVEEFLKVHKRLKIFYLPEYSPNLNLSEWLWNFARAKFFNNKVFKNTRQMTSSAIAFFRRIEKSEIRRVCNIDILLNRIT